MPPGPQGYVTIWALGAFVFTAIYSAVAQNKVNDYVPRYISRVADSTGVPPNLILAFVEALASSQPDQVPESASITPAVVQLRIHTMWQAYADAICTVVIIAAPVGLIACVMCLFLGDLRKIMN